MSEIQRIGIVGDGQLGRMLTQAALPMGFEVTVLGTAGPNSPAAQVGARQLEGALTDGDAIRQLAEQTDVVTWEIEHINADALSDLEEDGVNVQPSPRSLTTIQDKLLQKMFLEQARIPLPQFDWLNDAEDLVSFHEEFVDIIVKARRGGYDGRGNLVFEPWMSFADIIQHFEDDEGNPRPIYAEKMVRFQRELAVIGARDMAGRIALYPVVETVQKDNICQMVTAPAKIDPRIREEAEEVGRTVIESFAGAGVFAVELFQDEQDKILVNEVAPRVHNSGHFSIEGSETSQFEQHIRAITGMPLGSTAMTAPAAVMVNILGTRTGEMTEQMQSNFTIEVGNSTFVHWYGKSPRAARKIGHITSLSYGSIAAEVHANAVRGAIDV
jgi:phosphoribosylaminoimidazole carboxylase PurK protein